MSIYRSFFFFPIIAFLAIVIPSTGLKAQVGIPPVFELNEGTGNPGDIVCLELRVQDFVDIASMEFFIRFDPTVVRIDNIDITNSALNEESPGSLSVSSNFNQTFGPGKIKFTWFDISATGITLDDNALLFSICFEIIGVPGDMTPVIIGGSDNAALEIIQIDDEQNEIPVDPTIVSGKINVTALTFTVIENHCATDDNSNTGSIRFYGVSGTPPYSYNVTPSGQSGTANEGEEISINNLGPGNYTISMTDANNVTRTVIVNIVTNSEFPFEVDLSKTDPSCFDRANGVIRVDNINGGVSPFEYQWSNFEFTQDSLEDLLPGTYNLTITDFNGCTTDASITLVADTIVLDINQLLNPQCDESNDGLLNISASGGTPFPSGGFNWNIDQLDGSYFAFVPDQNPLVVNNLPTGTFEVYATDDARFPCPSDPIIFTLEATAFDSVTIETTSATCFGDEDGCVVISAGNTGNYGFVVTNEDGQNILGANTNVTYDACGLAPGEYQVVITDIINSCEIDTSFTIIAPATLLQIASIDTMGPGCGGGDGMAVINGTGGITPYNFLWNDAFEGGERINMGGGDYSVTLTDANGCQDSVSFAFADGGTIGLNGFASLAITCFNGSDGRVFATVDAPGTFAFTWGDEDGNIVGNTAQVDGLSAGIYIVTATDGECTDVDTAILANPPILMVEANQNGPTCPDSDDGVLSVSVQNGTSPFTYEWTQLPNTDIISTGPAVIGTVGQYQLSLTDSNGCSIDTLLTMEVPDNQILAEVINVEGTPCFDQCEGTVTINTSGGPTGTNDYTYIFSSDGLAIPANETFTSSTACPGEQWVIVLNGGCASDTVFYEVPNASPINVLNGNEVVTPPDCAGDMNGSIALNASGGAGAPFSYNWPDIGQTGSTINNLGEGSYRVLVEDANGCITEDTIVLETPDPLTVSIDPFTTNEINCFSSSAGRIGLQVSGGNPGLLTYNWNPNVSSANFAENLGPGNYEVTVVDSKGCMDSTSYLLESAAPISASVADIVEPQCFGGQTCFGIDTAFGGVGAPYTFTVNNGPRFDIDTCVNLFAGEYLVTVFDQDGCSFDTTVNITQPVQVIVDAGEDQTITIGTSSDPISANIVSELDIDSIFWTPTGSIECNTLDCQVITAAPQQTTTYRVEVVDENGCSAFDEVTVEVEIIRNVYFPNVFNPSNPGDNQFFQVTTGPGVTFVNYLRVYDRWGNLVYDQRGFDPNVEILEGWDGTYNGDLLAPGVFVYVAEVSFVDNNTTLVYKGDVTLLR